MKFRRFSRLRGLKELRGRRLSLDLHKPISSRSDLINPKRGRSKALGRTPDATLDTVLERCWDIPLEEVKSPSSSRPCSLHSRPDQKVPCPQFKDCRGPGRDERFTTRASRRRLRHRQLGPARRRDLVRVSVLSPPWTRWRELTLVAVQET